VYPGGAEVKSGTMAGLVEFVAVVPAGSPLLAGEAGSDPVATMLVAMSEGEVVVGLGVDPAATDAKHEATALGVAAEMRRVTSTEPSGVEMVSLATEYTDRRE